MSQFIVESSEIGRSLKPYIISLCHVGHIVEDLTTAINHFKALYGVTDSDIKIVPEVSTPDSEILTRFAFINVSGTQFELIQPLADPYLSFLNASPCAGGGLNHIAWQVNDLDSAVQGLMARGIKLGHVTPDGIVDLKDKRMAYLDPTTTGGMLIELIEFTGKAS